MGFHNNSCCSPIIFIINDMRVDFQRDMCTVDGGMGGYDIYVFDLDQVDKPEDVDMRLFVMRNINFEFDSAVIDTVSSNAELDSIASFMNENKSIYIEISGYTDDSGDAAHNKELSIERANAVKDALIERGVEDIRMVANGYGESRPLVPNDSEKNKALNRRVEIRIIY